MSTLLVSFPKDPEVNTTLESAENAFAGTMSLVPSESVSSPPADVNTFSPELDMSPVPIGGVGGSVGVEGVYLTATVFVSPFH